MLLVARSRGMRAALTAPGRLTSVGRRAAAAAHPPCPAAHPPAATAPAAAPHLAAHRTSAPQDTSSALRLSPDGWRVLHHSDGGGGDGGGGGGATRQRSPVVAVIDGTNLGVLSAASSRSRHPLLAEGLEPRFVAWLRFLRAATSWDAAFIAFDNKGSAAANVRAQLHGSYLRARARRQASKGGGGGGGGGGAMALGFAHLGRAAQREGVEVVHAAYGYEADDAMAALVQWLTTCSPQPQVLLVSSDSDMAQLLAHHVYWLNPAPQSGAAPLQLTSAAAFEAGCGYPPCAQAHLQALAGKPAASVPGLGLSAKAAKTLVQRFSTVHALLEAAQDGKLAAYPAAHQLLATGPAAPANRAALLRTLEVVALHPEQQQLPPAVLQACTRALAAAAAATATVAAAAAAAAEGEAGTTTTAPARRRLTATANALGGDGRDGRSRAVAQLHPAASWRAHLSAPQLQMLCAACAAMGVRCEAQHVTSAGCVFDLVVEVFDQQQRPLLAAGSAGAGVGVGSSSSSSSGSSNSSSSRSSSRRAGGHGSAHGSSSCGGGAGVGSSRSSTAGGVAGGSVGGCASHSNGADSDSTLAPPSPIDQTLAGAAATASAWQPAAAGAADLSAASAATVGSPGSNAGFGAATSPVAANCTPSPDALRPERCVALLLLGPADWTATPQLLDAAAFCTSPAEVVAKLRAQLLAVAPSASPPLTGSHLPFRLRALLTASAKRRLAQAKASGWRFSVVPFYELPQGGMEGPGGGVTAAAAVDANAVSAPVASAQGLPSSGDDPCVAYLRQLLVGQCSAAAGAL